MPDQSRGRAVSPSTTPHRMPAVLTVTLSPDPARTPAPAKDHPHREWRTRPHSSSPGLTSNTYGISDQVHWHERPSTRASATDPACSALRDRISSTGTGHAALTPQPETGQSPADRGPAGGCHNGGRPWGVRRSQGTRLAQAGLVGRTREGPVPSGTGPSPLWCGVEPPSGRHRLAGLLAGG